MWPVGLFIRHHGVPLATDDCLIDHDGSRRCILTWDIDAALDDPGRVARSLPGTGPGGPGPPRIPGHSAPRRQLRAHQAPPCHHASRAPQQPRRPYDMDALLMLLGLPGRGIHA